MGIELRNINKTFGTFAALQNVSLEIRPGELVALLGPSGSGKTTLLRILGGLETPDPAPDSLIRFHDEDVTRHTPQKRQVGFVFQHYALFRHMTVKENIAFPLRVRPKKERIAKPEIDQRVSALLKLVQLEGLGDRFPSQLSGGQRQRVALARSLAVEPNVLLLDEPFGALDAKVRLELRQWLRRLHDDLHVTSIFVTHDQEEALEVSDRVVIMNKGEIEQVGTPEEVFHYPANEFVMNFLGSVNIFHGRVEEGKAVFGPMSFPVPTDQEKQGGEAKLYVRPEDWEIITSQPGKASVQATIRRINSAGPQVKLQLVCSSGEFVDVIISHERFRELGVQGGNMVHIIPTRPRFYFE